jgi:hypothetical protein
VSVGLPSPQSVSVTLPLVGPAGPQGAAGAAGATGAQGPQGVPGTGLEVLTTQGDLLYQGASTGQRLPIGTSGQVLKVSGGIPAWGAESGAVSSVAGRTGAVVLTQNDIASTLGNDNLAQDIGEISVNSDWNAASGAAVILNKPSFGTSAASFCEGNDARLSDDRDPNLHAASHAAGTKASFFGIVGGTTGSVWIIADTAGTAGNSITLSFDGTDNITTVLDAWNSANPSNTAAFSGYGGDTEQVPNNGETITLSGGTNAGSDSIAYDTTPRFDSLIVGGGQGGAAFNWINSGEHLAHIVCQDGTSQTPLVMFGGSAQFAVFQDHNISSGFAHGLAIPGQPPDGIYRLTLYNGSAWNPKIIVPQTGTIDITENISLKDNDNAFTATFDVQNQLSDDVTLTIPDQSGTLAVVTDIPTTAGDVGAVAAGAITTSGLTQATARILGRTTASTGAVEEIQIGSGLSLSAGELSATGGSGGGEVRSDFVSPYTYTGLADAGTSESTASWLIRRSEFDAGGSFVATLTASAVEWDDRLTASYS